MKNITVDELKQMLHTGKVAFKFTKKDGSVREAFGTLNETFIPETMKPTNSSEFKASNLRYFDFDKNGWRSIPSDTKEATII